MWPALALWVAGSALAGEPTIAAIGRSNGENYKDRALAACLATAWRGAPAGDDADVTKSAFLEWTYYDEDKGNPAIEQLIAQYLRRDYSNPVEGYAGAQFKLLKCLDMYHSRELAEQVRKYVPHPDWVGDQPRRRKLP
jgi:hypothetical protein